MLKASLAFNFSALLQNSRRATSENFTKLRIYYIKIKLNSKYGSYLLNLQNNVLHFNKRKYYYPAFSFKKTIKN